MDNVLQTNSEAGLEILYNKKPVTKVIVGGLPNFDEMNILNIKFGNNVPENEYKSLICRKLGIKDDEFEITPEGHIVVF